MALLLFLIGTAGAQAPPEATLTQPPPLPDPTPTSGSWVAVGPLGVADLVDVAIDPTRRERWAVLDEEGAVWLTADGGLRWERLRRGRTVLSSDEALLVEVEARIAELLDGAEQSPGEVSDPDDVAALEDELAAAASAARDAAAQVQSELEGDRWFVAPGEAADLGRLAFTAEGDLSFVPRNSDPAASPDPAFLELVIIDADTVAAASARGPSISRDGARTFSDWGRGLQGVPCPGVAVDGPVALAACEPGLFVLQEGAAQARDPSDWIPLAVLVEAAMARAAPRQRGGSRWLAAAVPEVTATYQLRRQRQIDWDAAVWTTTDVDGLWFAQLALTWRPRSTPAAGFSDPGSVFVVDGDVFVDDGTPSAAWQSRAHRSAVRLRQSAASDVVALYRDRVRVAARVVRDRPLRQRVAHALRIAELDARLDALTGAAVSRWQAGDPALR